MLFLFFRRLIQSLNGDADKCPSSKSQYHPVFLEFSLIFATVFETFPSFCHHATYCIETFTGCVYVANVCVCFIYYFLIYLLSFCPFLLYHQSSSSRIDGLIIADVP